MFSTRHHSFKRRKWGGSYHTVPQDGQGLQQVHFVPPQIEPKRQGIEQLRTTLYSQ